MARRNSSKLTAKEAGTLYRHIVVSHGLREQILTHFSDAVDIFSKSEAVF